MSYGLAVTLSIASAVLFFMFCGPLFSADGAPIGSFPVDLSGLFYWTQWASFWLAIASLIVYAFAFRGWPGWTWRLIAPSLSLVLSIAFLALSMPLTANRDHWTRGALGWRVFLQTLRR